MLKNLIIYILFYISIIIVLSLIAIGFCCLMDKSPMLCLSFTIAVIVISSAIITTLMEENNEQKP